MTKTEAAGASPYAPAGQDYTLQSGRTVRFETPDLFAIAEGRMDIPNEVAADLFQLIYRGRPPAQPVEQFLADQKHTRSLFYAAQLVIAPRIKLEDDDETGVIDRRELGMPDLGAAYSFLLFGPPPPPPPEPVDGADVSQGQAGTE